MLLSLAFVSVEDITRTFGSLRADCPVALQAVFDYFQKNYISNTNKRQQERHPPSRHCGIGLKQPSLRHTQQMILAKVLTMTLRFGLEMDTGIHDLINRK